MTTNADFLADIIEHREDDGPRLVYADWLDEQGEEKRAEFIRVQCELACLLDEQKKCSGTLRAVGMGVQIDPLRRRTDELLEAHGHGWLPKVEGFVRRSLSHHASKGTARGLGWAAPDEPLLTIGVAFRRGFVAEITCTSETWLGRECALCAGAGYQRPGCTVCNGTGRTPGHADALLAATPLEVVRLTTRPTPQQMAALPLEGVVHDGSYESVLTAIWPVRFELPPAEGGILIPPEYNEAVDRLLAGAALTTTVRFGVPREVIDPPA